MAIKRTLTGIALLGALALAGCGAVRDSSYNFNGKLGNETVEFRTDKRIADFACDYTNILTVTRKDGKKVIYTDLKNNLILDEVIIDGKVYRKDAVGKGALKVAQGQFDRYMVKILEYKQKEAVNSIK